MWTPFHKHSPYPAEWLDWMVAHFLPRVILELEALPNYGKNKKGEVKALDCWRYLFDYYPWLLPAPLGRRP